MEKVAIFYPIRSRKLLVCIHYTLYSCKCKLFWFMVYNNSIIFMIYTFFLGGGFLFLQTGKDTYKTKWNESIQIIRTILIYTYTHREEEKKRDYIYKVPHKTMSIIAISFIPHHISTTYCKSQKSKHFLHLE